MRNQPKIYVNGKTLGQIAREGKTQYKTVNDRYHRYPGPKEEITEEYLLTDKRYKWTLVGLDVEQWLRFIAYAAGEYLTPGQLRGFVTHRRLKGLDEKTIARQLLAKHQIDLEKHLPANASL